VVPETEGSFSVIGSDGEDRGPTALPSVRGGGETTGA
jgi:hypothetical protein